MYLAETVTLGATQAAPLMDMSLDTAIARLKAFGAGVEDYKHVFVVYDTTPDGMTVPSDTGYGDYVVIGSGFLSDYGKAPARLAGANDFAFAPITPSGDAATMLEKAQFVHGNKRVAYLGTGEAVATEIVKYLTVLKLRQSAAVQQKTTQTTLVSLKRKLLYGGIGLGAVVIGATVYFATRKKG